jgi:hypothetical protein
MADKVKRIPYGIADYRRMQRDHMYYVDKTRFIPLIEAAPYYLIFIRPRRFGKSLWLSLLQYYYDVNQQEQFEALFGPTYIGAHPTPERYSYLTMMFNFATINPDVRHVQASFEDNGHVIVNDFMRRYAQFFSPEEQNSVLDLETTEGQLRRIFAYVAEKGLKLYLFIDEYDNFANTILTTAGESAYRELTHGTGFFRYFFNLLKGATSGLMGGLTRLFITGVSPIAMEDVTSGFNIGTNLSLAPQFNELLGLTEAEVRTLLTYYNEHDCLPLDIETCLEIFQPWYDGYRFTSDVETHVYNTDAVLYFVEHATREGQPPSSLIDQNLRTDYGKLRHLLTVDRKLNGNFSMLREIIAEGEIVSAVTPSFPVERLLRHQHFASLLYYLGLLTFDGVCRGLPVLRIPNLTVRELLYGYLRDGFDDTDVFRLNLWQFGKLLSAMAYQGEWQPVFDFLAQAVADQTSVRDYLGGEKVIQGFLLAYLNVTNYYLTWSERELGQGFADVYLEPFLARYPDMGYGYLIELKYIPRGQFSDARLAEQVAAAEGQLRRYRKDARVQELAQQVTFKGLILVYHGWELVYREEVA